MSASVGIVVPAYRPDVALLRRYLDALDEVVDPDELRVELDAARPETVDALADGPATVRSVQARRGKGQAITDGFEALETNVLAFADADGSTPATSVADVVDPVRTGAVDLAVGSRRHPDAEIRSHQSLLRRRLGDGFAWLARRALDVPLYDYQCGAKAMSRATWSSIRQHLYEPGFAWDLEVVAMASATGSRIREVPVTWEDHPASTVSPVDAVWDMGRALVVARRRAKRLQRDPDGESVPRHGDQHVALVDREEADA